MALTTRKAHKQQNFSPTSLACLKPHPSPTPHPLRGDGGSTPANLLNTDTRGTHSSHSIQYRSSGSMKFGPQGGVRREVLLDWKENPCVFFNLVLTNLQEIYIHFLYVNISYKFTPWTIQSRNITHCTNKLNRPFWVALPQVSFSNWQLLQW